MHVVSAPKLLEARLEPFDANDSAEQRYLGTWRGS